MADNEIRLNVTAVESEPLNVCVKQVPMNPVNVENTYKGIDYNLLKNKPSIDGVTLEGDKTTAEVIGFDKEYVDEAILTTNAKIDSVEQDLSDKIDAVSTDNFYTKEEIDNKVIVIEADIDAQADAIQKTRSDFMESDSELQQQINAHANELTTQKNDIDELGDQVAGIESKIPEGTSDTNPLINRQQLLDEEMDIRSDFNESVSELQTQITAQASAIANKVDVTGDTMTGALNLPELNVATSEGTLNLSITAGVATIATNNGLDIVSQTKFDTSPTTDDSTTWADALDTALVRKAQVATAIAEAGGGTSVPEGVYTQSNLLGGKNIEIVPEPVEGGIDEHTLACWHFDDSPYDEVSGLGIRGDTTGSYTTGVFGNAIYSLYSNKVYSALVLTDQKIANGFTVDCFVLPRTSITTSSIFYIYAGGNNNQNGLSASLNLKTGEVALAHKSANLATYTVDPFGLEDKPHLALQLRGTVAEVYVEGKRVIQHDVSSILSALTGTGFLINCSNANFAMDELRISDIARYDGDFTPPTQPYTKAEPTGNKVINFTGTIPSKTSELTNDSGFITADDLPESGGASKAIGEVFYSQSSLASDNPGSLPLFTGETITSADTIYPEFYNWVESHTELQTTAEEYETALTTYGECPKYVISDGSLRLPKLANYIKMANTTDGITQGEAGLPNITGQTNFAPNAGIRNDAGARGSFYTENPTIYAPGFAASGGYDLSFDASLSSEVYGKSDTVTPAHTTLYPWVCAYNEVIHESFVDATKFIDALIGKADTNLSNTYPDKNFRENVFNWGLPDYTAGVSKAFNTEHTAETNGWVNFVGFIIADQTLMLYVNGVAVTGLHCTYDAQNTYKDQIPVAKGDVYKLTGGHSNQAIVFYPCKGEVL